VLEPMDRILVDECNDRASARQDFARMSNMRPQALLLPCGHPRRQSVLWIRGPCRKGLDRVVVIRTHRANSPGRDLLPHLLDRRP